MRSPDLRLGDLSAADRVQAGDPMIFVGWFKAGSICLPLPHLRLTLGMPRYPDGIDLMTVPALVDCAPSSDAFFTIQILFSFH